jgi:hypothetical protein
METNDHSSKTTARRASKRSVTDGPFAETKELIGGLWQNDHSDLELVTTGEFGCPGDSR